MTLRTPKKLIFTFFIFINLVQSTKSADFHKVNENVKDLPTNFTRSKILNNEASSNYSELFLKNNFEQTPLKKNLLNNNLGSLLASSSKNKEELVIQSDNQSEKNNIIYAEGNVYVSYRGKQVTKKQKKIK